jgi:hypothetical protein
VSVETEFDPKSELPFAEPDGTGGTAADLSAPTTKPPNSFVVGALMIWLMGSSLVLLYALAQLWPEPTPGGGVPNPVVFFVWTFSPSDEVRLFYLVALTGALGGLVHTLRSFYWYIGNQQLLRQWLPMYLLLPFVAACIALIFYVVIRGGFFSPQASVQQTSPFGFVALAGLIGMFSPQAVLKLRQVAETVLTKAETGKDAAPEQTKPDHGDTRPGPNGIAAKVASATSLQNPPKPDK